jgi:hypothetical protein
MQTTTQQDRETGRTWHPISKEDEAAMTAMRVIVEPNKGRLQGTAARGPFDAIMSRVVGSFGVTFAPSLWEAYPAGGAGPKVRGPERQSFIYTVDSSTGDRRKPTETWVGISLLVQASRRLCPIIGWLQNIPFLPRLWMCVPLIWDWSNEVSQEWQLRETRPEAI